MKEEEKLDDVQLFDFTQKKKKKPKKKKKEEKPVEQEEANKEEFKNPYSYDFLLDRINSILQKSNPYATKSKKIHLQPVKLE